MRVFLLSIACLLILAACDKAEPFNNIEDKVLIGNWTHFGYEDSITIMSKSTKLPDNNYGFSFSSDGKFIERKNSGFCGTPPISYANYEGNWTSISDEFIDIVVDYWGGEISYKLEIMSIDETTLKCYYHY